MTDILWTVIGPILIGEGYQFETVSEWPRH
jgi:hypothetical protein